MANVDGGRPAALDNAVMLHDTLSNLVARIEENEIYTDGGYNGHDVDKTLNDNVRSNLKPLFVALERLTTLSVYDLVFKRDEARKAQAVTCLCGQAVAVHPARQDKRFTA